MCTTTRNISEAQKIVKLSIEIYLFAFPVSSQSQTTARGGAAWSGACQPPSPQMSAFTCTPASGTTAPPSGQATFPSKEAAFKV